ncbi:MAG: TraM recognition domain-containing protein [Minisyncoccia bacterium]
MSEKIPQHGPTHFSSMEEELKYLRSRIDAHEKALGAGPSSPDTHRIIQHEIQQYAAKPTHEVLAPKYAVPEYESTGMALGLKKETHDVQVDELIKLMTEKGIKNALAIATRIGSHLEDDFHRVLVQYIAQGLPARGLSGKGEVWRSLHMVLFEVSISSDRDDQTKQVELEKILNSMEQFFAGMRSMAEGDRSSRENIFTVEMAVAQGSEEVVFYVSVPKEKRGTFEKHLLSIYPGARITEVQDDYNIFHPDGHESGAYAHLANHPAYPIKLYKHFQHDPLNVVLSSFSKMAKHGEGAAIQFVIGNEGDNYNYRFKKILDEVRKGGSAKKAIKKVDSLIGLVMHELKSFMFSSHDDNKTIDQVSVEQITAKAASRIVPTNIRIIASAKDKHRADEIVHSIASTFNQFDEAQGNHFAFELVKGRALSEFVRAFTFRTFSQNSIAPLSIAELTTMCHLTATGVSTSRELKFSKAKQSPAPVGMPDNGITLGVNKFGGGNIPIKFGGQPGPKSDRLRHFYAIGQTGTGKSTLLKNMIVQDIMNGDGVCYIDPHGSDIVDILGSIPPERHKDVIYFDPAYADRPMGLNMMEYDPNYPEQKTFVVNEIFSIFEKLFGSVPESLGPMFQQYFRNGAMLVLEGQEPGTATLADIPRVLSNSRFRKDCIAKCKNPIINQFWVEVAEKAGGEASLENVVPYITSKTDIFLANDIMRPILAQPHSSFNFREIMDGKKIFLANLSKGRLGDMNASILGLFIVGKITQAALSRADSEPGKLPTFYLYIDEFQNFTTPSISTILSEARKYGLALHVAHQFIKQLDEKIRDAVFGNVGTKCVFRVGVEDAEFLEKTFKPEFMAKDITGLENRNAYLSLLIDGYPAKPFNMETLPPKDADYHQIEALKKHAYETFGRDRLEVENEIQARYMPAAPDPRMMDPFARF